jgi:hypothetical protein
MKWPARRGGSARADFIFIIDRLGLKSGGLGGLFRVQNLSASNRSTIRLSGRKGAGPGPK